MIRANTMKLQPIQKTTNLEEHFECRYGHKQIGMRITNLKVAS